MYRSQPYAIIRSLQGQHYPSGALITMAFWEYFLKAKAGVFRSKSIVRYILNNHIKRNSHNWATQDIVLNITRKVNQLLKKNAFSYHDGLFRRNLSFKTIEDQHAKAKARAEHIELFYRDCLSNPTPTFRWNSEIARVLYEQPTRYSTDPTLVKYFAVGDFE
jgi:hypothetical protein